MMRHHPYNSRYESDTLYGIRLANRPTISGITLAKHRLVKSIFCLNDVTSVGHQPIDSRMNAQPWGSRHTDYESDCRWSVAPQRIDSHSIIGRGVSLTYRSDGDATIKRYVAAKEGGRTLRCCDVENLWTSLACTNKSDPLGCIDRLRGVRVLAPPSPSQIFANL
jgi:hypothetical protein